MKTDKQKADRALKKPKKDIHELSNKEFRELAQPTGHVTETDLIKEPAVEGEPSVQIDGVPVITVANLQKLVNSLVFKLLS